MPRRYSATYRLRKRLKPGKTPPFRLPMTRKSATQRLRSRLTRARNLGLVNVRTGGLLGVETKFLDMAISAVAIPAPTDASGGELDPTGSGCTGCLSAPAQGDTASSRDGFKISMKSIQIEGAIYIAPQINQTIQDAMSYFFVALVLDTQTNGAQLNSEDVFTNPSGS